MEVEKVFDQELEEIVRKILQGEGCPVQSPGPVLPLTVAQAFGPVELDLNLIESPPLTPKLPLWESDGSIEAWQPKRSQRNKAQSPCNVVTRYMVLKHVSIINDGQDTIYRHDCWPDVEHSRNQYFTYEDCDIVEDGECLILQNRVSCHRSLVSAINKIAKPDFNIS